MKISKKTGGSSDGWCHRDAIRMIIFICTILWIIVAIKVFFPANTIDFLSVMGRKEAIDTISRVSQGMDKDIQTKTINYHKKREFDFGVDESKKMDIVLPGLADWRYINSPQKTIVRPIIEIKPHVDEYPIQISPDHSIISTQITSLPPTLKKASLLKWPPVQQDGTIPENEGTDTMPLTGLKVPRFWEAPEGTDINTIGTKVNGEETIFLMIASYRDFQCRETITSAFNRSDHPERLFVGAVDQVVPGDIGCTDLDVPCSVDPNQLICKYRDQISVYKMDAKFSTGPVAARHIGDRMYRGQYFVMQMDAHCLFVRHWDTLLIKQWESTHNEMAVLSSYLTDVQESIDINGDSRRNTRPIMCNSDFEGEMPARYLRHGAQPEDVAAIRDMPQLQPFWAAGFSFSRGHFKYRVPYDGYEPMVFQGEEIVVGIRGFTYGYDFYAPRDSVVFHEYAVKSSRRNKVHMFWENGGQHVGEAEKSYRRATGIIGMAPDMDPSTWDHTEEQRYGLGTVRPLSLFYKLFLIDPNRRVAVQLCPFVRLGGMHREFQKHLRPDGLGIDYSGIQNFDIRSGIRKFFADQTKGAESSLQAALQTKAKFQLRQSIAAAERIGLHANTSEVLKQAQIEFYGHPVLY